MWGIPEIPSSKILAFTFFGIILYIGSSYLNILQSDSSVIGMYFGLGLIVIGTIAQILSWIRYFNKKD